MRQRRTHQPLTYDIRLPDEAQADALRLLDASRLVVNQGLEILWPYLDEFGSERSGPAMRSFCDNQATSCDSKVRSMTYTAIGTGKGSLCLKGLFGMEEPFHENQGEEL
jgi:hypothetical protein